MIFNLKYIEKYGKKIQKYNIKKIINSDRKNYRCISMFPYPSGTLHIGHFRNYVINDVICRYKIIKGYKSFFYIGWDAFGLPAEKASIENNIIPNKWIKSNIKKMKKQIKKMNLFIHNYTINTSKYSFYKYSQKFFSIFLKKKYIYKKKGLVNWDDKDKTVLADEQVINGRGWRSKSKISKKNITMYFINVKKIKYTLYKEINNSNLPKKTLNSQINWIGKENYYYIKIKKKKVFFKNKLFFFISKVIFFPLKKKNNNKFLIRYTNKKEKIYIEYKDCERIHFCEDIEYLKKNKKINKKFIRYNKKKLIFFIKKNFLIKKKKIFKIKDWSISRQRYWGTPIPTINCKNCGTFICKKPKKLPKNLKIKKINPIYKFKKYYINCKKCKNLCNREFDTLDTFFDSSWYFLNYFSKNPIISQKKLDTYIGGSEHSILHLLYVKIFFTILKKLKITKFSNPFKKIIVHGMVLNKTIKKKKTFYEKMSKSKKNGVDPTKIINIYGSDSLRMYILFMGKIQDDIKWDEKKIIGCYRFLKKIWFFYTKININKFNKKNNYSIKKILFFYKKKKFNNIVSELMILFKKIKQFNSLKILKNFLIFLNPIAPMLSNIIWVICGFEKIFGFIYNNSL
ncbi:class I tRNA ligase family protein [Candidatus Vidania fulgoroideorum]